MTYSCFTRRALFGKAFLATASVRSHSAFGAQQMQTYLPQGTKPKLKGPHVFLDYDQEELDTAYDQTPWAPNQPDITKRNAQKSHAAVARLGAPQRFAYGANEMERLDLFPTKKANAPIHIHIHGGRWRQGTAAATAYQSEMFVDAGAHFITLDFNNVIETKGNLMTLAEQVRRATAWVFRNATKFSGDPDRIYVSGHSSGAHLAAVVLTTAWPRDFNLPANVVKGALFASGMYELQPVSLSARSSYVNFTTEVLQQLSPQRHLDKLIAPVIVAYGTAETPEFQRQAKEFAAAARAAGKSVELVLLEGYNHFEILESLGNPYGMLGRAVLRQMKLELLEARVK
jgi:arylformamidase